MEKERELAITIINLFEGLLDEYNIDIPSKDRDIELEGMSEEEIKEAGLTHIYGEDYYILEDAITNILKSNE